MSEKGKYVYLLLFDDEPVGRRNICLCETKEQAKKLVDIGWCFSYDKLPLFNEDDVEEIIYDYKARKGLL